MDEALRRHMRDDLSGLLRGEVLFDDLTRGLYSTDASIFQIEPWGVVTPRDEEDVQALVRYAAEHQIPLVPRGAGTGLAGESLGRGLIVDLSRHFRAILAMESDTVRVQPGVVYRELNAQLAKVGRRFAPDPASGEVCTLGGMVATNASGGRGLRHGYTREHVAALRAVLNNGEAHTLERIPVPGPFATRPPANRLEEIAREVTALLHKQGLLLRECQPKTRFNRCGYLLTDLLDENSLDLARLLVGSEGTLALITEATLRTQPLPGGEALVLLTFDNLDTALQAAQLALPSEPVACDLIERRLLMLLRGQVPELAALVPGGAEAILLLEYEADTRAEAAARGRDLVELLTKRQPLARTAALAATPEEREQLRSVRELALPNLFGLRGRPRPVAGIEDVAVPFAELPGFLRRLQELLQQHRVTASFLIHAGAGQVHTRPFLDLDDPGDAAKLWALAEAVHGLALALGGTVSTQHGTGLARTPWVARQYGRLFPAMEQIKSIFDPHNILNPGKIIGPAPGLPAWPLRQRTITEAPSAAVPVAAPAEPLPFAAEVQLHWPAGGARGESLECNGCGECRTERPEKRMCPLFRVTRAEAATPRAKANLVRLLTTSGSSTTELTADAVREVADLCVNCKMCAQECPAHVNIPKLMLEVKAANVAAHGLSRSDWVMARTERFASAGSLLALGVNYALESRTLRWLLEKFLGVSQKRRLPTFAAQSFLRRAARRGWTRPPSPRRPRAAYFVDVFANYNDPTVAEAVVAVLQHNGLEVFVPPGQLGCGIAPLAYGDVETAREAARVNVRVLVDLVREGYHIICSEPSAALMLRHDYLDLLDEADTRDVAGAVVEFTEFLHELHRQGHLRTDFHPLELSLGHHVPCHLKALRQSPAAPRLLGLIPRVRVHTIDVHCSGMAGTFGLKAENYEASREAGLPMLRELGRPSVQYGSTECSTCRMQMEDLGGKRTLHPAQYLALAYGLMPELRARLDRPFRPRIL